MSEGLLSISDRERKSRFAARMLATCQTSMSYESYLSIQVALPPSLLLLAPRYSAKRSE
jgi:hypothetical protein